MPQTETKSADKKGFFKIEKLQAKGMSVAIDLQLNSQDICMVSGPSGSGKSQFFKALADLIEHTGKVQLDEQALQQICPENWRVQVMYFSAETAWWEDMIATHFETLPNAQQLETIGLDISMLNANPDSLSSGEKQRLALLRGLQYQPKVLLLDEITANLDPSSEHLVETMVKEYVQQNHAIALWISHDSEQTQRMATTTLTFAKQGYKIETMG
ncbi:ATP-binding cassette domain-containing protein [Thiomicrorhabdus sp. Milos-T2]|uniref:ABC transporter ATP-binding protein n=1 Tax=Thiomicrorhabdus sp. Milos-T2 TaxID=90814 RepID=UPI000A7F6110|nr:ATP-binding cassette domain-containing protein [Thiomicrorhabdus sp. Milos-T2]